MGRKQISTFRGLCHKYELQSTVIGHAQLRLPIEQTELMTALHRKHHCYPRQPLLYATQQLCPACHCLCMQIVAFSVTQAARSSHQATLPVCHTRPLFSLTYSEDYQYPGCDCLCAQIVSVSVAQEAHEACLHVPSTYFVAMTDAAKRVLNKLLCNVAFADCSCM